MAYGFYIYTDRASIATTSVYSETSGKTYEYDYGTGQHSLSGCRDGHYLKFTAVPADGYEFYRWIYHIGSPSATTEYSESNEFTYYGTEGNDIYIAAEGKKIGSSGEPTITNVNVAQISSGSPEILITFTGQNIIGNKLKINVSYSDGTEQTYCERTITSENFETTITAESMTAHTVIIRFYVDNQFYESWNFNINLNYDANYFEWSSAVAQGLPTKNVSHTEWNNFIDKIIEVLTDKGMQNQPITEVQYGYAIGTTYSTMLNDCYLTYDDDLQGYPLHAKQFNIARFIIGSNVATGISDKISKQSKVYASDFITLENCLKTWQG